MDVFGDLGDADAVAGVVFVEPGPGAIDAVVERIAVG